MKQFQKIFAWLLVLAMAFTMMPVSAVKAEEAVCTVKMPEGIKVLPCDRDGTVSANTAAVNSFNISSESYYYFKVEGDRKYRFSVSDNAIVFKSSGYLDNTFYYADLKSVSANTMNVSVDKMCKISYRHNLSEERCSVAFMGVGAGEERNENIQYYYDSRTLSTWEYYVAEGKPFKFGVMVDDEGGKIATDRMTVKIGNKSFTNPEVTRKGGNAFFIYTCSEGVRDDFTVVVDGLYEKGSTTGGQNPAPTATPTPTPAPKAPAVGTKVEASDSDATFKVIDKGSDKEKPEVVYTKPKKSESKVEIPATIKDANGVEYEVTKIDSGAFKNDKKLTTVKIPATVETIGQNAFSGCKKLTKVTLGNNVETIGKNAFANCTKLKKVTITKSVTTIDKGAFSGCKALKTITISSKNIKKINKNAFKGVPKNATVKLPKGLTKKQKTNYKKMIQKAGFKGKIK